MSVISIDNVSDELGGDALAQMTERPLVRTRILGKSEAPEFECKAAMFATGNNLVLVGDMVRRAVVCTLDAGVERPELREFKFDPIDRVVQNRGAYVAACLTIARAYRAAGAPKVCRPLGSYGEWSDMVRAPLIWLGEVDPVESMETAREEDPELSAIHELFGQLPNHFGDKEWTTAELIKIACERDGQIVPGFKLPDFKHPKFARTTSACGGRRRRGIGQAPRKVPVQDRRAALAAEKFPRRLGNRRAALLVRMLAAKNSQNGSASAPLQS